MLQRRSQDPTLRASSASDSPTVRVTFEYLVCATVWLLVVPRPDSSPP